MSFVEFALSPLGDIEPWGKPGDLSLSWFGLSLGRYRLKAGDNLLLNYSDEAIALLGEGEPTIYPGPFVDYPVVRLWEDLTRILPFVLRQVPTELEPLATLSLSQVERWSAEALDAVQATEEVEVISFLARWHGEQGLDTAYLSPSADISFWRRGDLIEVRWDNVGKTFDGVPAWSAVRGSFRMSVQEFVSDIQDFNDRFMGDMAERVRQVCSSWDRSDVRIDLELLRREQKDRSTWFARELARNVGHPGDELLRRAEAILTALPPSDRGHREE